MTTRSQLQAHARRVLTLSVVLCVVGLLEGCVTVRPEQRSYLADPTMQFDDNPEEEAALQHVLDNREGSYGGGSVEGGGCGCN